MKDKKGYKFGDAVIMIAASEDNQLKYGYFVRKGWNNGFLNRGAYFEITDGLGKFWKTVPDNVMHNPDNGANI